MYRLPDASSRWLLEDPDSARLKAQHPDLWADPQQSCITCHFEAKADRARMFPWWNSSRSDIVQWECNCTAQWIIHRYLLNNGIGKSYQRLGWIDATDVPDATQLEAMTYLDHSGAYAERGMNLILHSPDPGTGKTMMLMLIAKGLMQRHHDVFVAQMNSIVEMYTSGWRDKADKDHFERRIMNCGVLCIDDLGKETGEKGVDFIDRLLDRVIRHRTAASTPTLVTTNLTPEQLDTGYNQYVASLLTETCVFVETSGLDWRPKARERTQDELLRGLVRPLVMK
jgi:DNA replication protein DnaC